MNVDGDDSRVVDTRNTRNQKHVVRFYNDNNEYAEKRGLMKSEHTNSQKCIYGTQGLNRAMVEICCGETSYIFKPSEHTKGCCQVRVTARHKFQAQKGINRAIAAINYPTDGAWISIPCAAGCRYPKVNWAKPIAQMKQLEHYCMFEQFKPALKQVMDHCRKVGALIFME